MSLIDTAGLGRLHYGRAGARTEPDDASAIYLLFYNDPDEPAEHYGLGWSLAAWDGSTPRWSVSLAARGAGAHAAPSVAQAAAAQVLGGHGVRVQGWSVDEKRGPTMFRARLLSTQIAR